MTPTYITTRGFTLDRGLGKDKFLPVGSFVTPIKFRYLPQHIKDSPDFRSFKSGVDLFCYTHYGIVVLPVAIIRKVEE